MTITTWDPRDAAGPDLIGILLQWALFGVLSLQVYTYSQFFPKDKFLLKTLVGVVYILEVTQTFMLTQTIWDEFTSKSESAERFDKIGTIWASTWVVGGLVGLIVQSFYAYRITIFARNMVIPCVIILISFISFGGVLGVAVLAAQAKMVSKLFATRESERFPIIGFWGMSCVLCDAIIVGYMCCEDVLHHEGSPELKH